MLQADFYGSAKRLPVEAITTVAKQHQLDSDAIQALINVESGKSGYMSDGRPYILFEAHWFSKLTDHKYDGTHPNISSKTWNRDLYGAPGRNQYVRLEIAMSLDMKAALQACSWGRFQIMGFHYNALGFNTVEDMVGAFCESEAAQLDAFIEFLGLNKILQPLRELDWPVVAYKYNGPSYSKNKYDEKLALEYKALKSNVLKKGSKGEKVAALQRLLVKRGYTLTVDGSFGSQVDAAVRDYQSKNGLAVDGTVGPQTFANLAVDRIEKTPPIKSKRIVGGLGLGSVGLAELANTLSEAKDSANASVEKLSTVLNSEIVQHTLQKTSAYSGVPFDKLIIPALMCAFAGYFIWTKFYDDKKESLG